ncbi:MAG TPA: hypothetical protein VHW96_04200 [Solirubrobacteraceae bacterium]|jgi:hypothetical protein|nr:hypothetical protein [Solirubrobacteraceae bacterium]
MSNSIQRHSLGLTWVETTGMRRAAHALRADGRVWLIDPFEDEVALSAATELGSPAAVIQLLDRHNRACGPIAQRLEVPLLRLPAEVADSPFTVIPVINRPWWREVALWWEAERALVVAEAVGTAPAFALGRRVGLHPMLRLRPPKGPLTARSPERLLVGHGAALESGAASAIRDALSGALADIPQLVLKLPSLVRGT